MKVSENSMDMIPKTSSTIVISSECGHGLQTTHEDAMSLEPKMKRCSKCGRVLPTDFFAKKTMAKDGLQEVCRDCKNAYQKEYYNRKKQQVVNQLDKSRVDYNATLDKTTESKVVVDEKERTMLKVYSNSELAKFTPRQLMAELKARGFRWEYMLEPQRKVYFDKI